MEQSPYFFTEFVEFKQLHHGSDLAETFKLRFEVYCQEAGFLPEAEYSNGIEEDIYDNDSLHVGCYIKDHQMAGTVRLIRPTDRQMPLLKFCQIDKQYQHLFSGHPEVAEVSRLCIRPKFRHNKLNQTIKNSPLNWQRNQPILLLGLFRGLYQVSKLAGIEEWVIAIERNMYRMLKRNNIPFVPIGPESDYYGLVRPYASSILAVEEHLAENDLHCLRAMSMGLPKHLLPEALREEADFLSSRSS